jgi:hypothetical protein
MPGGGSTDICNVSPSDQIGQISNILNRLQQVEAALAALLGTDVEALQLSDISNNLGWVYNVTYLGEEGWTQTPSGTLIPPAGWSGLSNILDGFEGTTVSAGTGRVCLHRVNLATSSDVSTGTSYYIQVATTPASDDDSTYYGTDYFTPGTDGSGNYGWECLVDGVYDFLARVDVIDGSSAPTTGNINTKIYKLDTIYKSFVISGEGIPVGGIGSFGAYYSLSGRIQLAAGDYVNLVLSNGTDGDLKVSQAAMVGILVRTL